MGTWLTRLKPCLGFLGGRGWDFLGLGLTWKWGLETHLASWRKRGSITLLNSEGSMTSRISSSSLRNITSLGLWVLGQNLRRPTITCERRRTWNKTRPQPLPASPGSLPALSPPTLLGAGWPWLSAGISPAWIWVHKGFSCSFREETMSPVRLHPSWEPASGAAQKVPTGKD